MATPAQPSQSGPENLITIKVLFNDSNRRFKLPLKDLRAHVLPQKVSCPHSSFPDRTSSPRPISYLDHPIAHLPDAYTTTL